MCRQLPFICFCRGVMFESQAKEQTLPMLWALRLVLRKKRRIELTRTVCLTFELLGQICNSLYCQPYNSYNVSSEI